MTSPDTYKSQVLQLVDKYGTATNIPTEQMWHLMEVARAWAVVAANPGENPVTSMRRYAVSPRAAAEVLGATPEQFVPERKTKRADKYAAIVAWCEQNAGVETTVYHIAEIGDVSYSTANNFVKDRIDLFHKVKKGQYIVRDPKAERAAEK